MKNKISDQPSLSLLKNRLEELKKLSLTQAQKETVDKYEKDLMRLIHLADSFNQVFSNRGWLAYESLSVNAIQKSLDINKSKGLSKAEEFLVDYYDQGVIERGITRLWGVSAFRSRLRLIKLSYEDFTCGRYHACIPVLLMMIDGVVADNSTNIGFFSEKSDLTSWDSVSGH